MEIHTEKLLHRLFLVSCLCKGSKEPVNRGVVGWGKDSCVAHLGKWREIVNGSTASVWLEKYKLHLLRAAQSL